MSAEDVLEQLRAMQNEMATIRAENLALRREQAGVVDVGASLRELALQMKQQNSKKSTTMIDIKGLGRPKVFDNTEASFSTWSKKFVDFIESVHPKADLVMEWAAERTTCHQRARLEGCVRR